MHEAFPKILIASTVRQKPLILKASLESLNTLDRSGLLTDCLFVDNNDNPESSDLLKCFRMNGSVVYVASEPPSEDYCCTDETHYWNNNLIWKVAAYKDFIIQFALGKGYSHVFMVDSDLVLHPHTLKQLTSVGKDIVSEIFWTKWTPDLPELPQVWLEGQYSFHSGGEQVPAEEKNRQTLAFLTQLRTPGLYKVGGLGACTLISRKAMSGGISYRRIDNVDYWGEDRHFCIRAAILGFELYADTQCPAFHIYRESDLSRAADYKAQNLPKKTSPGTKTSPVNSRQRKASGNKLTLSMIVRNEENRYLTKVLQHARQYIDSAVIIDDASKDNTIDICLRELDGIPLTLIQRKRSGFSNEYKLRRQQWRETIKTNPDWILSLDADEMFEDKMIYEIKKLINQGEYDSIAFRLYDFWNDTQYREDEFWCAHKFYRPFLVRYLPGFLYKWKETPQHCGRLPCNISELATAASSVRVKHFGWLRAEDRVKKYNRYLKLDPEGLHGVKEQYESILDENPNLITWEE